MSTTQAPVTSSPGTGKPQAHFHWGLFAILILIAAGILYFAGAFRQSPTLALVTSGETPYWDAVIAGANEAARQYDVNLVIVKSKTDVETQNEKIKGIMGKGYAGIGISPVNPLVQAAVMADVAAETNLVTFDSDSPVAKRLCFVGTDGYAAGRLAGDNVRKAVADGGEVVISIGNLERENAQRRRQGVIDELLERPYEPEHPMDAADAPLKGDKYTVVATLVDGADPQKATDLAAEAIKAHPNLKCIVGLNGYTTPAVLKALDQSGKAGKIQIIGFDADKDTLGGIKAGNVYATIVQDQFGCGFHTVRILAEAARGNTSGLPIFQRRTLPVEVVNKDNVDSIADQMKGGSAPLEPAPQSAVESAAPATQASPATNPS